MDAVTLTRLVDGLVPLPPEQAATQTTLDALREIEEALVRPVTDEQARILLRLFQAVDEFDDMAGLLQTLMADLETAPGWGLGLLEGWQGGWYDYMRDRWQRYLATMQR